MKLAVIFPALNQFDLTDTAVDFAKAYSLNKDTEIIVLDNASDVPYANENCRVVRLEKNIGVYPIFWEALKHTDADLIAFLHTDLMLSEQGWDNRVMAQFEAYPDLGLLGFIGSNEIDPAGGRGGGTTSNFQGNKSAHRNKKGEDKMWVGSPAEAHGKRSQAFSEAVVVDGCSMVLRRSVLEKIKQRENFPPHHFYDRLLSCEVRELGFKVGVLGVACDHISGQTVSHEDAYSKMAEIWCLNHGLNMTEHNWDTVIYKEAEKQWLSEYRDTKHFIPCKV